MARSRVKKALAALTGKDENPPETAADLAADPSFQRGNLPDTLVEDQPEQPGQQAITPPTELLAMGNTLLSSVPFQIFDGESASIYVSCSLSTDAYFVWLERQRKNGTWQRLIQITSHSGVVLHGAGVWRVTRDAQSGSVQLGVERG